MRERQGRISSAYILFLVMRSQWQSASSRIYMYHNVLDLGKGLLYLIMNLLGNAMGSAKGLIAFYRNFQVDIHLIPKTFWIEANQREYLFLRI